MEPKYSSIEKIFFRKKCALYTCHSSVYYQKSGNLNLSYGEAYNNLVNIHSKLYPDRYRIKPGYPEKSLLINRLEGTLICGVSLERAKVYKEEIEIIRQWIRNGAIKD
ncbi:MAG: hypothetical protein HY934_10350 [Candidatus Firestonebacteria bacterium]|nr:hypothetical protein [Candidatus Firestonebacteria bacterium]